MSFTRLAPLALLAFAAACNEASAPHTMDAASIRTGRAASVVASQTMYSERFTRGRGAPETIERQVSTAGFVAPFTLHVRNGDASGANRVSSATVAVDGITLLDQSAFNQNAAEWSFPLELGATASLKVMLAGAPGGHLEISIEGVAGAHFCSAPGTDASDAMRAALDATPAGGTILVCDGTHTVQEVVIDKPITIRSANPGGATLSDREDNDGFQFAPPVFLVVGVESGVVRFADIGFSLNGRGVVAQRDYHVVEIDSARFTGRDTVESIGVMTWTQPAPGARVEVTNSTFEGLGIAVFAVGPVETNVRSSTFDRTQNGPITYSSQWPWGSATDNVMTNCRNGGCIRVFSVGAPGLVFARNRIESTNYAVPLGAIRLGPSPNNAQGPITVEDNVIVSRVVGDMSFQNGWGFPAGVDILAQQHAQNAITIRRNRITQAYSGVTSVLKATLTDNVIEQGVIAFRQNSANPLTVHRNDFIGLAQSFTAPASAGDYQCNWWGGASGPFSPPPAVPASAYTPWATEPIAGTTLACSP